MRIPTGVTPTQYWNAIKADNPTHVEMVFANQGLTLDDSDIDISTGITISDIFNGDTDLTFGKAVCKQLTTRIILTDKTRYMNWTDDFELKFGVEINGTTNWVTFGFFAGERPKNVSTVDVVDFTAYDPMAKFDVDSAKYISIITNDYPTGTTVRNLYNALCDYIGVGKETLPADANSTWNYVVTDYSIFENMTCRDVLSDMAEAGGYYARINSDGNCEFVWFQDNAQNATVSRDEQFSASYSDLISGTVWDEFEEMTWDEAETHTWDDICGDFSNNYKISCVAVRYNNSQKVHPTFEPVNAYIIEGNAIAFYAGDGQAIYNKMTLFGSSLPITIDCIGNWLVESGDIIYVELPERIIPMRIYTRTFHWNGSAEDMYETTGTIQRTARK